MNRADVSRYIKRLYDVMPDYPFAKEYAQSAVFRHKDTEKWFALCMEISADKLGYDSCEDCERIDVLTVKSEPMLIDSLILKEGFHRAYHMNKKLWLTIELNDKVLDTELKKLIQLSYELTDKKRKAKSI